MHNDEKTLVFAQSSQFLRTVLFVSCLTFQLTARANKSRLKTDKLIPNSMSGHSSFCLLSTSQHSPHAWTRTSDNKNPKECRKRIPKHSFCRISQTNKISNVHLSFPCKKTWCIHKYTLQRGHFWIRLIVSFIYTYC